MFTINTYISTVQFATAQGIYSFKVQSLFMKSVFQYIIKTLGKLYFFPGMKATLEVLKNL